MIKRLFILLGVAFCTLQTTAQVSKDKKADDFFDEFTKSALKEFDDFSAAANKDYEDFRRQCWEEFADFVRTAWKEFDAKETTSAPEERPLPPIKILEEQSTKPMSDRPVVVEEVVNPIVLLPRPQPSGLVKEKPMPDVKRVNAKIFGTPVSVRFDKQYCVRLKGLSEEHVAEAVQGFTPEGYDNMLFDCLAARTELALCDWAYLQMLQNISAEIFGADSNDATLLTFYLYSQSGYATRLASNGEKLYMLYASKHYIYNTNYYNLNGMNYYCTVPMPARLRICEFSFKKEQDLSLLVTNHQQFEQNLSEERSFVSKKYPEMKFTLAVNRNLLDFYSSYPASNLENNALTGWAMYANKPMAEEVVFQIYPALRAQLKGLSQLEAVNHLLNFVQTGFEYAIDTEVWGAERALFAEESLHYPYCDCEDRSILFTRLVRDLLGLKCLLVHYPGHLASAVEITEGEPEGDYFPVGGHKYYIADGTILSGASVGRTMSGMDNAAAKVIVLE